MALTATLTRPASASPTRAAYAAFAAYGVFWGTWGAALPELRDRAGVSDAQLGTALLCIALGALPAMLLTGRAVDRWGRRVPATALVAQGVAGVVVALAASGPLALAGLLLAVGAASGSGDVAINAVAGAAERASGRPVITRCHGAFSAAVVVASLGTGALRWAHAPVVVAFGLAALAGAAAGAVVLRPSAPPPVPVRSSRPHGQPAPVRWLPMVAVGLVAAAALAVENAHQSWGAVYLGDVLAVAPGPTAAAPAVFAAVAAASRFAAGALTGVRPSVLLVAGACTAAAGTGLLAAAPGPAPALAGLALAAAGTSVLYPTLLATATRDVPEAVRGRATSAVATTGYLGFLLGPVLVGALAQAHGLRWAMAGVAGLAALIALAPWTPLVGRRR